MKKNYYIIQDLFLPWQIKICPTELLTIEELQNPLIGALELNRHCFRPYSNYKMSGQGIERNQKFDTPSLKIVWLYLGP